MGRTGGGGRRSFPGVVPFPTTNYWRCWIRPSREATQVLDTLSEQDLAKTRRIQVYDVTGLQAVLHVVEHFAYHTGQIIYITRLRENIDLKFYDL